MMLTILAVSLLISISQGTDYCSVCPDGKHTMCLYTETSPSCLNFKRIAFNDHFKQYIVDVHNDIRNHIASGLELKGKLGKQPPAANMLMMHWDEELAEVAQRWADQCIPIAESIQHDFCRKTSRFEQVGQNILTAITNGTIMPELAILILNWYKQVVNVIPTDISFFSGMKRGQYLIGQYTQLVWAKTAYVGCGMAIYKEQGKEHYDQRLVCNYGPGGNILGKPIYKIGQPCSRCPTNQCDSFRKALCENGERVAAPAGVGINNFEDWLNAENNLNIRIPGDDCLQQLSGDVDGDDLNLKSTNVSIPENFQTVWSPWVLNMTGYNSNVAWNQSYNKLFRYLKFPRNSSDNDVEEEFDTVEERENIIFLIKNRNKRAIGRWYHGRCHCDKIIRSNTRVEDKFYSLLRSLIAIIVVVYL
ncbi:unnamed protein product [Phyllotreta striolata]|uniref:SCP domain-containing protein n=1 Tax=Phyllotreta striolata TaxID=444603 RepID=A0A9N9TML5_PHYSR|nr:unnamed protein product [Phyllotreta striolata]